MADATHIEGFTTGSPVASGIVADRTDRQRVAEARVAEISSLLAALEEAASESGLRADPVASAVAVAANPHENRLAEARLGLASSLFFALNRKHPQSASHSLRVALGCSSWALYDILEEATRDVVEVAALLHDIGKIGVPDKILQKPGRLTDAENALVTECRRTGWEVLAGCCSDDRVLAAVRCASYRYDGSGNSDPLSGEQIPLAARMIAIVDAFDSMTTDQVYRRALSREHAIAELMEDGARQFDPNLVRRFAAVLAERQDVLTERVAARWLGELSGGTRTLPWVVGGETPPPASSIEPATYLQASAPSVPVTDDGCDSLFQQKLIDAMHDGVVFVDSQGVIFLWSKGAERLTGVSASAAAGRLFAPTLLDMCTSESRRIADEACPVRKAITTHSPSRQRMQVLGRHGHHVAIDLQVVPVVSPEGREKGATLILHDAQPEAFLEEKCEALHDEATRDPLTRVANRAEFDRMQALFIEAHQQAKLPCSLIMTDIDHFKQINDTYGHQAGDEAIITVANLLKAMSRTGDLVARYGGEEFALLCADCSNADAARRAEQIRRRLSETPHSYLGNKRITASFGVTELQAGDSPETMLRRADRALLQAKGQGRNQVIQLGGAVEAKQPKKHWWSRERSSAKPVVETRLRTAVPIDIAIQKLRGFVSDQKARIVATKDNRVELEISTENIGAQRRKSDQVELFRIVLTFSEERFEKTNSLGFASGQRVRTLVEATIAPKKMRQRRSADHAERARLILQSLKAYLMAKEPAEEEESVFQTAAETK